MMKIESSIDFEKKVIVVNVTGNIICDFYSNFVGLAKSNSDLPQNMEIVRTRADSLTINIPTMMFSPDENSDGDVKRVVVPVSSISPLIEFINMFARVALKHLTMKREFLPLHGYPEEKLQADVLAALDNKRDLVIIDKYSSYLRNQKETTWCFNQKVVRFEENKSEYCDIVLLLQTGQFSEFRRRYKNQLTYCEWL